MHADNPAKPPYRLRLTDDGEEVIHETLTHLTPDGTK
jgi:hypothetical protein